MCVKWSNKKRDLLSFSSFANWQKRHGADERGEGEHVGRGREKDAAMPDDDDDEEESSTKYVVRIFLWQYGVCNGGKKERCFLVEAP